MMIIVAGLRICISVCIFRQVGSNVMYIYGKLVHLKKTENNLGNKRDVYLWYIGASEVNYVYIMR